jgi:hypothetical protein
MNQHQQVWFFAILFLGSMTFCDIAQAQFAPDPFFYRKPHQIAPQKYRKQNDGTILETKTGNIYDRRGNLIQRGNGSRANQEKKCRYISTNNCSPFNMNCQSDWHWDCS